jgi:hypothetical protein
MAGLAKAPPASSNSRHFRLTPLRLIIAALLIFAGVGGLYHDLSHAIAEQSASYKLGYWYATNTLNGQSVVAQYKSLQADANAGDTSNPVTPTQTCELLASPSPPAPSNGMNPLPDYNKGQFIQGCESAF